MKRLRAWFDSTLSQRGALAGWAVAAILGLVLVGTLLLLVVGTDAGGTAVEDLPVAGQVFLSSLARSLGIATPSTLLAGALTLWFWFIGLLVMGTIFAWRTNALTRTTTRIMAGRTPITDRGHTVILGWSPIVPVLVRELALASGRGARRTVALLSAQDRRTSLDAVEDALAGAGPTRHLRVITRAGDPWNPGDLHRVNCAAAATIIIVDDPTRGPDASMTLALAVSALRGDADQRCIVQVRDAGMRAIVERAADSRTIALTSADVILRALAQSARQPGVTETLFELLDFGGSELYRQHVDGSAGLTYAEVASRLVGGAAVGVVRADGATLINPPAGTVIGAEDRCLVVKGSADELAVLGPTAATATSTAAHVGLSAATEPHVGIVGPAGPVLQVAANLRSFLTGDAQITLLSCDPIAPSPADGAGVRVHVHQVTDYFGGLAERVTDLDLDQVAVLADATPGATAAEVDARTSVSVAVARRALAASGRDVRFVAQVLDPTSRALIPVRASDDLIVSEEAAAMMIVQAAADPVVFQVLVDLLDPSVGSAIHVLALPAGARQDVPLRFRDLVDVGLRAGVSVIGWRHLDPETGWTVDLAVDREAPVPDLPGFGVLAIAGSTEH